MTSYVETFPSPPKLRYRPSTSDSYHLRTTFAQMNGRPRTALSNGTGVFADGFVSKPSYAFVEDTPRTARLKMTEKAGSYGPAKGRPVRTLSQDDRWTSAARQQANPDVRWTADLCLPAQQPGMTMAPDVYIQMAELQQNARKLQLQLERARLQYAKVVTERDQLQATLNELRNEKKQDQLGVADERAKLIQSISDMRAEFANEREKEQERSHSIVLDLRAKLEKEEALRQKCQEQVHRYSKENDNLTFQLNQVLQDRASFLKEVKLLRDKASELTVDNESLARSLEVSLRSEKEAMHNYAQTVSLLNIISNEKNQAEQELRDVKGDLSVARSSSNFDTAEAAASLDSLESRLKDLEQQLSAATQSKEKEVAAANQRRERETALANQKAAEARVELEALQDRVRQIGRSALTYGEDSLLFVDRNVQDRTSYESDRFSATGRSPRRPGSASRGGEGVGGSDSDMYSQSGHGRPSSAKSRGLDAITTHVILQRLEEELIVLRKSKEDLMSRLVTSEANASQTITELQRELQLRNDEMELLKRDIEWLRNTLAATHTAPVRQRIKADEIRAEIEKELAEDDVGIVNDVHDLDSPTVSQTHLLPTRPLNAKQRGRPISPQANKHAYSPIPL